MLRSLFAVCVFSAGSLALLLGSAAGQQPADKKQPAKGKYDPPAAMKPDAATLNLIAEKTKQLRKAIAELKEKKLKDDVLIDVEIYLKAAENIVRLEEWYSKDSGKWALTTLDRGLERAKSAADGNAPWREETGKWIIRAYRSIIDGSIQPYAVLLPHDYGKDPEKYWRLDIVLHGRDSSLTESKFIATHNGNAPKDLDYIHLEPYGRGNNAYRWAGESDVNNAESSFSLGEMLRKKGHIMPRVLRGFSMGGAGTWHLGLHHPLRYRVLGPGAGFTTTHGYVAGMPGKLPDYQEKCLRIYDAVDYAENAFNIPIVAYSGEKDPQKKAADNIENALKDFEEPFRFTHLVAPGLEHQMPKAWQEKAEAEYQKYTSGIPKRDRIRFVTYTPRYNNGYEFSVEALQVQYQRAVVDWSRDNNSVEVKTRNVRRLGIVYVPVRGPFDVVMDGQEFKGLSLPDRRKDDYELGFEKKEKKWVKVQIPRSGIPVETPIKSRLICGPIDDAFMMRKFSVVKPADPDPNSKVDSYAIAAVDEFARNWDRYFRGSLQYNNLEPKTSPVVLGEFHPNWVLFGTPQSNPYIAKVLPKLPITWTADKLRVNGVDYDPKTHVPVLIYPNPLTKNTSYVVINSGHTFREADLKGTNALLYPRLGDWAVIKPTPTAADPAAYEVVAAGLFDENWQFPKKEK
ncbi:MAG TPA: hypothetical protein VGM92_14060 [Candidatus Kapabacteria bacterium]